MDVEALSGTAVNAQFRTQNALRTESTRLSSGLRINSAGDDPSGLAISQTLATKVAGLDQGVHEIQNASNALTVAESAMGSISSILQRMRSIVVQARSDLSSDSDRKNMQAELDQLRLEIDKIAQDTTFNGRALLDGSASSKPTLPGRSIIEVNDGLSGGGTLIDQSIDPATPNNQPGAQQVVQQLTVTSYDPVAGTLTFTAVIGSQDGTFGPDQTATQTVAVGTNFSLFGFPPTPGFPTYTQSDQFGNPVMSFNIGTLTSGDVGKTSLIVTLPAQIKAPGGALYVNAGDAEGAVIGVDIPAVSSVNLGVNQVVLGNDLQNQGAEYRLDYAITALGGIRAEVGAQAVSMQYAADGGNIASVNTQASESAIRDLNVGAEVTAFTRDTILSNLQTKIIADTEKLSQNFATLVADAIVR